MAGVIMPSAVQQRRAEDAERDQDRPPYRQPGRPAFRSAATGNQRRQRERMPPSPWLSARITMRTYLIEMTRTSA